MTPPPPGSLFGPDSQFHRFFNDPRWALAVIRATVLEAAHPQVGAALADNSTFVAHPWRRLRNTLVSLQRMFGADDDVRQREAARLNRLHARLSGTDARERPYDAMDPEVRAWVVATLFESSVTMCRLSGQPLDQATMERLYDEFRAFLGVLEGQGTAAGPRTDKAEDGAGDRGEAGARGEAEDGAPARDTSRDTSRDAASGAAGNAADDATRNAAGNAGHLPATLAEFWPYYDRVIAEELENTEAVRIILYRLFDHLPAPPVLHGLPTLWAAGRALAGPVIGTVTVASLPEPFQRRAGLPEIPGARTLMRSAYLTAGLARFLPDDLLRTEAVIDLLYTPRSPSRGPSPFPGAGEPGAVPLSALRDRMHRAAALLRLVTPFPTAYPAPATDPDPFATPGPHSPPATPGPYHSPPAAAPEPARSADEFFTEVLDQTGNGTLDWPDLAAMARELSSRLDLDEPEETRLYQAYAEWWRELQAALDTDGDGRISRREYAAAVPSLAGPALIRVAEVLFDATDKDGNQFIDAEEYRALFRTGFGRTVADPEAGYSRAAFVKDFLAFMSGRRRSTPYDPLLADG
ncbi:oxygenase MpaB family protein [Streptomyces sp. NPDC093085]|uniref:oxygenase MpaB family protein n=1 Tax=Streptomyces sp. NPDC093085 TaxID=3155068 RepID=UPI00343357D6